MCGIAGYFGQEICEDVVIKFLHKLEYRGYDSSGIAIKKNNKITLIKDTYKIDELEKVVTSKTKGAMCIAHTRWATHGKANKENAHPHFSMNKVWYAVHNGIIENYIELKNNLENENVKFNSNTDSEVIPELLEHLNVKTINEFIFAIQKLKGSYAICAFNNFNNSLYLAKNKNPLYITKTSFGFYVSSDPICFNDINCNYYTLNDNEFCEVCDNNLTFYNKKGAKINKKLSTLNNKYLEVTKENYSTFMEKEIQEIPKVFQNIIKEYKQNNYFNKINSSFKNVKNIVIIGCGTAYHSGLIGATYLQNVLKIPVSVELASEFICSNPIINKSTAYIFVSQSGETADTLCALEMVKGKCNTIIGITNVTYSTLSKKCNVIFPIFAGPEIAVASTKAYNAQLLIFYLFSLYLKNFTLSNNVLNTTLKELNKVNINALYHFENLKKLIPNYDNMFILGKYKDYYTAMEASLKIREITYSNCSALASGELKHGTLALVSNNTVCFVISNNSKLHSKTINSINEIKARHGKVVLITNNKEFFKDENIIDYIITLPNINENLIDIISIIPFQIFSLMLSLDKGYNPDKPRNLAKSVTVE